MPYRILLSNLGYARGISGELADHIRYAHRHFYCSPDVQKASLGQLNKLIAEEDPDICCLLEIDKGSFTSGRFNQLEELVNERYAFFDIENKYAQTSQLRSFFITEGKSNAFIAKQKFPHEKIYFKHGIKRLIYKIPLNDGLTLFFAHFSLKKKLRALQILEVNELIRNTPNDVIFLGDFNILSGLKEIAPLLEGESFILLNQNHPTFQFHKRKLVLDLCICSKSLADRAVLKIVPQPYSDHAALILDIDAAKNP